MQNGERERMRGDCEELVSRGEAELPGHPQAALDLGRRALGLAGDADPDLAVRTLLLAGSAEHGVGNFAAAIASLSRALEIQRQREKRGEIEASLLQRLAEAHRIAGDLNHARELCDRACELATECESAATLGAAYVTRAFVHRGLGDLERTAEDLDEALRIASDLDDPALEIRANIGKALTELTLGESAHALERLEGTLARARREGQAALEVAALNAVAVLQNRLPPPADSLTYAEEARRRAAEIGDRYQEAEALRFRCGGYLQRDDVESAERSIRESVKLHRACGSRVALAAALSGLAGVLDQTGEHKTSLAATEEVMEISSGCGYSFGEYWALGTMGLHHGSRGDHQAAIEMLDRAVEIATAMGDGLYIASAHEALCRTHEAAGDATRALEHHRLFHKHRFDALSMQADRRVDALRVRHELAHAERVASDATEGMERSAALNRAILDSLLDLVAVLDPDGRIVAVNSRWLDSGRARDAWPDSISVGADYLAACADERPVAEGIRQVLRGERQSFECEYECSTPDRRRWFKMFVTPLVASGGGVVISHAETTLRKRDELRLAAALEEVSTLKDRLEAENVYLTREISQEYDFGEIVGESEAMRATFHLIDRVAKTDVSVLLLGETGTGKELFARAIHARSERCDRPLVKVDCAALPSGLIENELLGHVKGAFTGAHRDSPGRFELADGGTILLDEIGELPRDLQTKLLRVLQDGELERLGSAQVRKVDVRVIAATNRNLEQAVARGEFRADLYYRLNSFPITLPPLREREGDVPLLVRHFIRKNQDRFGTSVEEVSQQTMEALRRYDWPGNVRELAAVVERGMILSTGKTLSAPSLPAIESKPRPITRDEAERVHIRDVLGSCSWRIKGAGNAAEQLGLPASTLRHRMKKLGIERPPDQLRS